MSSGEAIGTGIMLGGGFFVIVAAVGTVRLPDVYCRSHALGKAMTLGIMLLLVGYGLRIPETSWLKLATAALFQLVTIPVASHLFCLVAYRHGVRRFNSVQPRSRAAARRRLGFEP